MSDRNYLLFKYLETKIHKIERTKPDLFNVCMRDRVLLKHE